MYKGIDISRHNGVVNIKKVRDAGYGRVIIRAGFGKDNTDEKFEANAQACVNFKEPSGIYWFSYALNECMSNAEAGFAVEHAKKYWSKCPIAFDYEYDSVIYARKNGINPTRSSVTAMAIEFLKVVMANGYIPVLYTNKDYLQKYFDLTAITKALGKKPYIWYARYTSTLTGSEKELADIWQYSSKGKVDGISGSVDMNEFYTDFEDAQNDTVVKQRPVCNINILNFQKMANKDGYRDSDGNKLIEDGIDGADTQYVRKQITLKAKRIGIIYKVGSKGYVVAWYQSRLQEMGFPIDVDMEFGNQSRIQTIAMQKKYNLTKDGVAGYNTLSALFYN